MTQRRVFVRQHDGNYAMIGLIESDEFVNEVCDEETGERFKFDKMTPRYVLYVPDVVEMVRDDQIPDAWKPFVEHGLHDNRQPTPGV
jgi:hypothetical protein